MSNRPRNPDEAGDDGGADRGDHDRKEADYEVGYGKPPIGSRFQRGQTGNPLGRPRKTDDLNAIVDRALHEQVEVTIKGKVSKHSKIALAVMQLATKAASGDARATDKVLKLKAAVDAANAAKAQHAPNRKADLEAVQNLVKELFAPPPKDDKDGPQ